MQGLLTSTVWMDPWIMGKLNDTILLERGIINPLGPSKPGILNRFTVVLSNENIKQWMIHVHFRDHFPNSQIKTYGIEMLQTKVLSPAPQLYVYEVEPTEVVYLNQEKDPCKDQAENIKNDIWSCLESHFASKLNCSLPWQSAKNDRKLPVCSHPHEFMQYMETHEGILDFETDDITQTANCMPSCRRVEYSVKLFNKLPGLDPEVYQYLGVDNQFKNALQLDFFFGKDRFSKREQYYAYDMQNLVADFGGYLGLLLGYSLLALYDSMAHLLTKLSNMWKKNKSA